MEYPRHLHKPGGLYYVTHSEDDHAAAAEYGWNLQPEPEWVPAYVQVPHMAHVPDEAERPALSEPTKLGDEPVLPIVEPAAAPKKRGRPKKAAVATDVAPDAADDAEPDSDPSL